MNFDKFKKDFDSFFNEVAPEDLIKDYERLGCQSIDIDKNSESIFRMQEFCSRMSYGAFHFEKLKNAITYPPEGYPSEGYTEIAAKIVASTRDNTFSNLTMDLPKAA